MWSAVPQEQLWDQAKTLTTIAHCLEWLSLNDDVVKCTMHSNYPEGVSDTERSNRLMQVSKHCLCCAKATHLDAVFVLVEQTLGCCRGEKKEATLQHESSPADSRAWGYTNMQQAYQSTVLIFKLQVQNSNCKIHNAMQQMLRMASSFYAGLFSYHILIHMWRVEGVGGIFSRWWKG